MNGRPGALRAEPGSAQAGYEHSGKTDTALCATSDTHKGSYYANPLSDDSGASDAQRAAHPSYLRSNVWPSQADCDGFEAAFKALARFMVDVGRKLARACDDLVAKHSNVPSVEGLIANSQCSKARLLHYYPPQGQRVVLDEREVPNGDEIDAKSGPNGEVTEAADSWCGTHLVGCER